MPLKKRSEEIMKKITSKLKRKKTVQKPERITNATVAEHRERILSGASRFRYPVQYTRQQLVLIAAGIGVAVLVLFVAFSWWQLYRAQTTSQFFYRVTRLIPLPVAQVDGETVRYGDYLLNYKSSETYLSTVENVDKDSKDAGAKAQFDYMKSQAMRNAVVDTYAAKLARENNISISGEQVDQAIQRLRQTTSPQGEMSQEAYDRSLEQLYGLSPDESRYNVEKSLLRQDVAYAIDDEAKKVSDDVEARIKKADKPDFEKLGASLKEKYPEVQVLTSGWVKQSNPDGGIAAAAAKLEKGKVVGPIKPFSGDGYYFIQLIDRNKSDDINYAQIKVPLLEFNKRVERLQADGKVHHYISVPDVRPQVEATDE